MSKTLLITGGAGFIGSALIRLLLRESDYRIVNVDRLTYAASPDAQQLLRYPPPRGLRRHREIGSAFLAAQSVEVDPDDVIVTSGAQHAIMIIAFGCLLQLLIQLRCLHCLTALIRLPAGPACIGAQHNN